MSGKAQYDVAEAVAGASLAAARNGFRFLARGCSGRGWSPIALVGGHEEVLLPGDRSPDADVAGDCRDYRGVAVPSELGRLAGSAGFPLGRYMYANGRRKGELRLPEEDLFRHCAVIGPPGSGKTAGIMVPWIHAALESGASVVTVDVKGDLRRSLRPPSSVRRWIWNPFDRPASGSWNWLASLRTIRDVEAAVASLLGKKNPSDANPYFYDRDVRWLRALIRITHRMRGQGAVTADLYALVGDQNLLLQAFRVNSGLRDLAGDVADLTGMLPDEHSRAVSGLLNALHVFEAPDVRAVTVRSDFDLPDIDSAPTLLIVGAPLSGGIAAETLSGVILGQLISALFRRFQAGDGGLRRPIYLILDEAPRYHKRIGLEELLAVGRSARVGVCLAAQDVTQFGDSATAILANCSTTMVLPGASAASAQAFASSLGKRVEREVSVGRDAHFLSLPAGRVQKTTRTVLVPVLQEREIMHPPIGPYCATVQVKHTSSKPFLVDIQR